MRNESEGFENFADRPLSDIFHDLSNSFSVLNLELDVLGDSETFDINDRQRCRERTLRAKDDIRSKTELLSRSTNEYAQKLSRELSVLLEYDWKGSENLEIVLKAFKTLRDKFKRGEL